MTLQYWPSFSNSPSIKVATANNASSCTPPALPLDVLNICSKADMIASDIWGASSAATFLRTLYTVQSSFSYICITKNKQCIYHISDHNDRVFYSTWSNPGMYLAVLFYQPGKKIKNCPFFFTNRVKKWAIFYFFLTRLVKKNSYVHARVRPDRIKKHDQYAHI